MGAVREYEGTSCIKRNRKGLAHRKSRETKSRRAYTPATGTRTLDGKAQQFPLKGQLFACDPRWPQWQHWAELWSTGQEEEELLCCCCELANARVEVEVVDDEEHIVVIG